MTNARYAPPLSEWPEDAESCCLVGFGYSQIPHRANGWVSREERAGYEAQCADDAEYLRGWADELDEGAWIAPDPDRLCRIADQLEGKA